MKYDHISERLWDFSGRIGKAVDALPDTRMGRHVAGQLVRCGTSGAPNYDEGCAAESRDDFIHKLGVVLKEMRESRGWIRFITRTRMLSENQMNSLLDECEQLCNIIAQSILTAKRNKRGKG